MTQESRLPCVPTPARAVLSIRRRLKLIDRELDLIRCDITDAAPRWEGRHEFVTAIYDAEAQLAAALKMVGGRPGPGPL